MSRIARGTFDRLIQEADHDAVLRLFDDDPAAVRRLLTRLTYTPDTILHDRAIQTFCVLSRERAALNHVFFREIIRRHIWGMNEEGGNIDWSAPEIIGAVITGSPELFSEFIPLMFNTAAGEPIFHKSLLAALDMIATVDPDAAAPFLRELQSINS